MFSSFLHNYLECLSGLGNSVTFVLQAVILLRMLILSWLKVVLMFILLVIRTSMIVVLLRVILLCFYNYRLNKERTFQLDFFFFFFRSLVSFHLILYFRIWRADGQNHLYSQILWDRSSRSGKLFFSIIEPFKVITNKRKNSFLLFIFFHYWCLTKPQIKIVLLDSWVIWFFPIHSLTWVTSNAIL